MLGLKGGIWGRRQSEEGEVDEVERQKELKHYIDCYWNGWYQEEVDLDSVFLVHNQWEKAHISVCVN